MVGYVLRRALYCFFSLLTIVTVVFFLMHSIPGGPFVRDKQLPPEIIANLNARYNLDAPLVVQYVDYVGNLLKGDLGPSFKYKDKTVNDLIKEGFPVSATLGAVAICFALFVGCTAGIVAALNHNKWPDFVVMLFAMLNFSIPSFILAPLLIYFFSLKLNWLPAAMWGEPAQVILPAMALGIGPAAFIASLMRSSMVEVLSQDYIKTARAKGLSERLIIYRHGLRNAILPVITYLGSLVATILTGSFVIERIFAIPGLGEYFVTSISNRDYTVIMGITVFYSSFLMLVNLIVDIVYCIVNPRIRLTSSRRVLHG